MVLLHDGIYILLKEVLDNCIDEFVMGAGKTIEVSIKDKTVAVRDYGRGIPLEKWLMLFHEYRGKYDSLVFKKSVGLNGVEQKQSMRYQIIFEWSRFVMTSKSCRILSREFGA
jgi:DNA gyrase/topoisomerase IV subunit B